MLYLHGSFHVNPVDQCKTAENTLGAIYTVQHYLENCPYYASFPYNFADYRKMFLQLSVEWNTCFCLCLGDIFDSKKLDSHSHPAPTLPLRVSSDSIKY